jgi:hypothetical protein
VCTAEVIEVSLESARRALIRTVLAGDTVPRELKSKDEFQKLLKTASEVRVSRQGDEAKIKLRTKEALYTFKTTTADADSLIKGLKTPVVEF